jgi:hypothetical protein
MVGELESSAVYFLPQVLVCIEGFLKGGEGWFFFTVEERGEC